MRNKKFILFSLLGLALVIAILTSSTSLGITTHKVKMQTSVSSSWNNSKSIGQVKDTNAAFSFSEVPVIVTYKEKKVGDVDAENPIQIDISDKDFGSFWFPLIKTSDYNFSVTCKNSREVKNNSCIAQLLVDGNIQVSGHYKFIGTYTKQAAENIVIDQTLDAIYKEARKNLK